MGTFPDADASRLHISNVVHGSFGFQLAELSAPLIGPTPLAEAVERSLEILASTRQGENAFAETIADEGQRIRDATFGFLETLRKAHAAVKLISDKHEVRFNVGDVPSAVDAVQSVRVEESEQEVRGTFGGMHLDAQRFEHVPDDTGKPIYGKVDPSLGWADVVPWVSKTAVARIRVTRTFVGGIERRPTYVLLGLTE